MIATILTTLCREAESFPPLRQFSRQFSRQSVASDGAGRHQISRYFGGIGATHPSRHETRHGVAIRSVQDAKINDPDRNPDKLSGIA
jgi:hypothetical protein